MEANMRELQARERAVEASKRVADAQNQALRNQLDEMRQKLDETQQSELLRDELVTHHSFCEDQFDKERTYIDGFVEANPDYAHLHRCDLTAARIYTRNEIFKPFNIGMRATTAPDSPADGLRIGKR